MKSNSIALAIVLVSVLTQQSAWADVESHDDEVNCDFTIIGWTKQSLIERKQKRNNFDDSQIKAKNKCIGKIETLQFAIGSGNISYSPDSGTVYVNGSFKNTGDKYWTTRNLKIKEGEK